MEEDGRDPTQAIEIYKETKEKTEQKWIKLLHLNSNFIIIWFGSLGKDRKEWKFCIKCANYYKKIDYFRLFVLTSQ